MKSFFNKYKIWILSAVALLLLIVGLSISRSGGPAPETFNVVRANVVEKFAVTGHIKPAEEVALSFERSGKVSHIYVKVGQQVAAGSLLATLSAADLAASLDQARAAVVSQEAKVQTEKSGSRPEDVSIAKVKFDNAVLARENARQTLGDALTGSYLKSDTGIRNNIDQFYSNASTKQPVWNIQVTGEARSSLESGRLQAGMQLQDFARVQKGDLEPAVATALARSSLSSLRTFVSTVSSAINGMTPDSTYSATVIAGYRADVASARTNIESELANVTSAYQAWQDAEAGVTLLGEQYNLAKAPARSEDIAAAEGRLLELRAQVRAAEAELAKASIRAPFAGLITRQEFKLGQTVGTSDTLISLIAAGTYDIEANVAEADVAEVAVGQEADVTLDALPVGEHFAAKVVALDPADTIIDGVATYKVTLHFITVDPRMRPGLSANVTITTALRKDVLAIPVRMLIEEEGKTFVNMQVSPEKLERRVVMVGLRSSSGTVEILEGLQEGDVVVAP